MEQVLQLLAAHLFGATPSRIDFSVADVTSELHAVERHQIEAAIQLFVQKGLIHLGLDGVAMRLLPRGKRIFEKGCIAETCLGFGYIVTRYSPAVVHVIIRNQHGDEHGGSGFFCDDFEGWVVTDRHVVAEGHTILRIEDFQGQVIARDVTSICRSSQEIDLALLECSRPDGVKPLRLEWAQEEIENSREVMVMGYPPIAGHLPTLLHPSGEIVGVSEKVLQRRKSLLISRITEPGYSGGPVINRQGLVVGVIEQENETRREGIGTTTFIGAIPANYLSTFTPQSLGVEAIDRN